MQKKSNPKPGKKKAAPKRDDKGSDYARGDKDHGAEVPKPEGNVAKLVERGRQMGF